MKKKLMVLTIGQIWLIFGCGLLALSNRYIQRQASAQESNQVAITNYKFEPKKITVQEGGSVTWTNKEGVHAVKSDTDIFISKTLKAGETFNYQFMKAGTYPYYCSFHGGKGGSEMSGTIVVVKKK